MSHQAHTEHHHGPIRRPVKGQDTARGTPPDFRSCSSPARCRCGLASRPLEAVPVNWGAESRFGWDGQVAGLGRIKRFSPTGKFLGVVGTAKIVPGCKHLAIGVSKDASRVFLLDITRTHIVVMARRDATRDKRTNEGKSGKVL